MRRGSFRPRPIQNKKALPILQTGVLTFYDETGSHKTTIPQFSHLIDDPNAANIAKSTTLIDIPTPIVHTVQDYKHEVRGGYKPPVYFIRSGLISSSGVGNHLHNKYLLLIFPVFFLGPR